MGGKRKARSIALRLINNMIPDQIIVLYVAFLNNYKMVTWAIEQYYTELNSVRRARLLQELSRSLKGKLSDRLRRAENALPMLDTYNKVFRIEKEIEQEDLDFSEAEILTILTKAGVIK